MDARNMAGVVQTMTMAVVAVFIFLIENSNAAGAEDTLIKPYVEDYYGNLSCHHCVYSVHGNNCVRLRDMSRIERQHCRADQNYCMVERYTTDGAMQTFTRGCSKDCTDGCSKAGVNYVIEKCYSCCSNDFCNVGNSANGHTGNVVMLLLGVTCVLLRREKH